jgi:hypothetical protein
MRTTPSGVSWADLSAQTMPSYRANAHEAGKATNSGAGTKSGRNWSPHGQAQVWLPGHGHGRLGGFSTLNMQAWRNDASVCSLSQILETGPIPSRYYLSVKACLGIIRRAAKRGKELPALLARALKAVVTSARISNARADCSQSDSGGGNTSGPIDVAACLTAKGQRIDFEVETFLAEPAHTLRAEGFDASEDGTGRGTPLVPVCVHADAVGRTGEAITPSVDAAGKVRLRDAGMGISEDVAFSLTTGQPHAIAFPERMSATQYGATADLSPTLGAVNPTAVAFDLRGREGGAQFEGPHDTANIRAASGGSSRSYVAEQWAVRRLTPTECERLQGYPDGHTLIEFGSRRTVDEDEAAYLTHHGAHVVADNEGRLRTNAAADGPRYKGLGNAWAVKCVRPIAKRIMERQAA